MGDYCVHLSFRTYMHAEAVQTRVDCRRLLRTKKQNIKLNAMEAVFTCVPTNSELTSKASLKHTLFNPRLFPDTVNMLLSRIFHLLSAFVETDSFERIYEFAIYSIFLL